MVADFAQTRQRYRLGRWRGEMAMQWTDDEGAPVSRAAMTCMDPTSNVVVHVGAEGTTHTSGLMRCGNVGLCPVCAPTIRARRAADIEGAHEANCLTGGQSWFATFTVPHGVGDSAGSTLALLRSMWRDMQQSSPFRSWREAVGLRGFVRSWEVTYGDNGFHWHLHVLFFTERSIDPERVAGLWRRQFERVGLGGSYVPGVSFDVRRLKRNGIGSYIGKVNTAWGAGAELARADLKRRSVGPAQLLELAFHEWERLTLTGEVRFQRLWEQLENAAKGLRWIEWSRGLRVAAGSWQLEAVIAGESLTQELLTPDEASDVEAAAGSDADEVVASWHVPASVWRRFRRIGELGVLLSALVSNDGERFGCWRVVPHRGQSYSLAPGDRGSPRQVVMAL